MSDLRIERVVRHSSLLKVDDELKNRVECLVEFFGEFGACVEVVREVEELEKDMYPLVKTYLHKFG